MKKTEKKKMYVGIDISKNNHQVNFLNPTRFKRDLKISNDREGFEDLTDRLSSYRDQGYEVEVACEPTGHYWENLGYHLKDEGFVVKLVNPFHTSRYKELLDNSPQKDDRKDSWVIAHMLKEDMTLHENLPEGPYGEIRKLIHHREDLMEEKSRLTNKLTVWLDRCFPEYRSLFSELFGTTSIGLLEEYGGPDELRKVPLDELTDRIRSLSHGKLGKDRADKVKTRAEETIGKTIAPRSAQMILDYLLDRIRPLLVQIKKVKRVIMDRLAELKEGKYLQSIPGVGWWGAAVFVGEVGDPTRLPRARSVVKIAGLNLFTHQSGKYKGELHITKRGRPLLRKMAYLLAKGGITNNEEFSDYYSRKKDKGVKSVSALTALGAKILRIMYGVVKNEQVYKPLEERTR